MSPFSRSEAAAPLPRSVRKLNRILSGKGTRRAIVLNANAAPRVATYMPLAKALARAGYLCILNAPNLVKKTYKDTKKIKYAGIGDDALSQLRGVDLYISAEHKTQFAPPDCVRMVIWHSLPDTSSGLRRSHSQAFIHKPHLAAHLDYLFVSTKQNEATWKPGPYAKFVDRVHTEEDLRHRPKRIVMIPGGYPKVQSLGAMARRAGEPDRVVFCPTQTTQPQSHVEAHGAAIIAMLLEELPEHKVVFRPYPGRDTKILRNIARQFEDNDRFIYDRSVTGEGHVKRAAFCVTDASSAAVTFSLATLRPSIFFRPDRESPDRAFEPIGVFAHSAEELRAAIRDFAANAESWARKIEEGRAKSLHNPDTAIDYLVSIVPVLLARGTRDDWLTIPRRPVPLKNMPQTPRVVALRLYRGALALPSRILRKVRQG